MPHRSGSEPPGAKPIDLAGFSLSDMLRCGGEVRRVVEGKESLESAAKAIVGYLYDVFRDPVTSERSCVLVRFYRTLPYEALEPELQLFARMFLGGEPEDPRMKCLTLLATAGEEPEWNDRRRSKGHRAIPLPSPQVVERAPMIAQLVKQMGLDLSIVTRPAPAVVPDSEGKTYNIFFVDRAEGSPYIPAQHDFVIPHGIQSVVGFGGVISGDLFAVILFTRVPLSDAQASRFRNIALDVKSGILGYPADRVFAPPGIPG